MGEPCLFHLVVVAVVVLVLVPLKWNDNITERIERKFSLKIAIPCTGVTCMHTGFSVKISAQSVQ